MKSVVSQHDANGGDCALHVKALQSCMLLAHYAAIITEHIGGKTMYSAQSTEQTGQNDAILRVLCPAPCETPNGRPP